MSGKQILSLVLAIVVGVIAVRLVWGLISFALGAIWWIVGAAITVGVVYALYRGFNHMLASGKRLT